MTLQLLISNKAFEQQQQELQARFTVHHIDYLHQYGGGDVPALTVWLNQGNIPVKIVMAENGKMDFSYFFNGRGHEAHFINCSAEDFQAMLEYAITYLINGDFDAGRKEWFERLELA